MKIYALLLASAAFVTPALAADVIYEEPMAPAPAPMAPVAFEPAFTWTGLYAGGQAGVAFNNEAADFFSDDDDFDDSSFVGGSEDGDSAFVGGVHIGYDYQINNFIVGGVADINYIDAESSSSFAIPTGPGVDDFATFGATQEIDFIGTARGKLGLAVDRFALYATGGLAYADVSNESFGGGTFLAADGAVFDVSAEEDSDDFGYAVGAGVDYLVTDNLSLGVEYLYHDLGSSEVDFTYTDTALTADGSTDFSQESNDDLDFHTVWAKASFRFN